MCEAALSQKLTLRWWQWRQLKLSVIFISLPWWKTKKTIYSVYIKESITLRNVRLALLPLIKLIVFPPLPNYNLSLFKSSFLLLILQIRQWNTRTILSLDFFISFTFIPKAQFPLKYLGGSPSTTWQR